MIDIPTIQQNINDIAFYVRKEYLPLTYSFIPYLNENKYQAVAFTGKDWYDELTSTIQKASNVFKYCTLLTPSHIRPVSMINSDDVYDYVVSNDKTFITYTQDRYKHTPVLLPLKHFNNDGKMLYTLPPLHSITLQLGTKCNAKCAYCPFWKIGDVPDTSYTHMLVNQITRDSNIQNVKFTGGEPTLYADELIGWCNCLIKAGKHVTVLTNGTDVDCVNKLFAIGCDLIIHNIQDFDMNNIYLMSGETLTYQHVCDAFNYNTHYNSISFAVTLTPANKHFYSKLCSACSRINVKNTFIQTDREGVCCFEAYEYEEWMLDIIVKQFTSELIDILYLTNTVINTANGCYYPNMSLDMSGGISL